MTINQILRYRYESQLLRYGMLGLLSNLIIYLLYLLITYYDAKPKTAMTLVYILGASISFFANRKFTFSDKGGVLGSGIRYAITNLFGYLLNFFILMVFVDKLGYPHQLVQGIAIFVVAGFLFVCFKLFVFRNTTNCNAKDSMLQVSAPLKNTTKRKVLLQRSQKN